MRMIVLRRRLQHSVRCLSMQPAEQVFMICLGISPGMLFFLLHLLYYSLQMALVDAYVPLVDHVWSKKVQPPPKLFESMISVSSRSSEEEEVNFRGGRVTRVKRKEAYRSQPPPCRIYTPKKSSIEWIIQQLDRKNESWEVEAWTTENVALLSEWNSWMVWDQLELIKYLGSRRARNSVLQLVQSLEVNESTNTISPVKVCTSALFAIAPRLHEKADTVTMAWSIMDRMDRIGIAPTSLTVVGLLQNIRQGPSKVLETLQRIETKYRRITWDTEIYHAAINACRFSRQIKRDLNNNKDENMDDKNWQTALQLMQQMQRKHRIKPTSETYLAVLQVLGESGKIPVVRSLIQQWRNANAQVESHASEERIWATAMIACAKMGDFRQASEFIQEMEIPNLRHCTSLLMAFANGGKDQLAIEALDIITRKKNGTLQVPGCSRPLFLPKIDPDMVALNTVLSAAAKAGNYEAAVDLVNRIRNGEFVDPTETESASRKSLSPDRITYHNLLVSCSDPRAAKEIVKEMRLSRRNRYGAIPPTNVTYAHAIRVCHRAKQPDMDTANTLLEWANDDKIQSSKYMYSSAIWTAQRCGDVERCLELYEEMKRSGCPLDSATMNGVLSVLADSRNERRTLDLYNEMKDQGLLVFETSYKRLVSLINSNTTSSDDEKEVKLLNILSRMDTLERQVEIGSPIFEALISLYGSRGNVDQAMKTMEQIEGYMDALCLRAILLVHASCPKGSWKDAVDLLHTSDIVDGAPGPGLIDQIALSHVILACSRADEFDEGLSLLRLYGIPSAQLSAGAPPMKVGAINSLIAACGRGGCPEASLALLNEMTSRFGIPPDSRSYRSAVIACNQAQHGDKFIGTAVDVEHNKDEEGSLHIEWWEVALSLLHRMKEEGLTPDVQTYSSVISACEAAGQWQRALGVLQSIIETEDDNNDAQVESDSLNLYCWNAAISACEKGGAWVEALDLYERMLTTGSIRPNSVTLNSLLEALDRYGQKELANSKYAEGLELDIVKPWRKTKNAVGESILALDLHKFSAAMARAAIRNVVETFLDESDRSGGLYTDLVIITGKGLNSAGEPVLQGAVNDVLLEYGIEGKMAETNSGRIIVDFKDLLDCFESKSWK